MITHHSSRLIERRRGLGILTDPDISHVDLQIRQDGLTSEKLENLKILIKHVEVDYRWYYENILRENIESSIKKRPAY